MTPFAPCRSLRILCPALLLLALAGGCAHNRPRNDLNFSVYHDPEFQWCAVRRVVVLPVVNESNHPEGTEQIRRSLDAELQQLGLFEVIPTPPEVAVKLANCIREGGKFNEAEVIELARCTSADVLLVITLSHYSPYFRPRIGLTVQAISPDIGKVVSAVDGLWDSNNLDVADRARQFYVRKRTHTEHVRDHVLGTFDDSYGKELALESPHLFQRFVAGEVAHLLVDDRVFLDGLRPALPAVYQPKPMFTFSLGNLCGRCRPGRRRSEPQTPAKTPTEKTPTKDAAPPKAPQTNEPPKAPPPASRAAPATPPELPPPAPTPSAPMP